MGWFPTLGCVQAGGFEALGEGVAPHPLASVIGEVTYLRGKQNTGKIAREGGSGNPAPVGACRAVAQRGTGHHRRTAAGSSR